MTIPTILEINCETGEQTERPMTKEEIAAREAMSAESLIIEAEREAAVQAKADAKLTAQAKLQALGLTGEEIAAITE